GLASGSGARLGGGRGGRPSGRGRLGHRPVRGARRVRPAGRGRRGEGGRRDDDRVRPDPPDEVCEAAPGRRRRAGRGRRPRGAGGRGARPAPAARLEAAGRTLVLTPAPPPRAATYPLRLPVPGAAEPVVVEYDLCGVEVTWDDGSDGAPPAWSGWWPGISPAA